jgi:processing peptidase subunit beta
VKLAEKAFGALPQTSAKGDASLLKEPAVFVGSDLRQRDDHLPLAHVSVAFQTQGWTSPHAFPLMVMQTILGQWDRTLGAGPNMASPLCRKVAEDGLAHAVSAFNTSYKDTGLFGVYSVAEPHKLWDLQGAVLYEMTRLCHQTSAEEVERAKTQLKTSLLGGLDGSTAVCEDIGRQMLTYGRRLTPAEIFARIEAVDVNAVKAAADRIINDKDLAIASVGNVHELPDYNWSRRRTYWLRY